MSGEKILLRKDDLEAMAELIEEGLDCRTRRRNYAHILRIMAKSMLSDDALVVSEEFFDREHGV